MKIATVILEGAAPLYQGKMILTPKKEKETHDAHEKRCWQERAHVDAKGRAFVPPFAFKNCIAEAAKYLGIQIPGKGKANYTKHFEAGVLCLEPLVLTQSAVDIVGEWRHVPADGRRGGSKRVMKCFPVFAAWGGTIVFHILDDVITKEVFLDHLTQAGQFIGVGSFRPRNNGIAGRFNVKSVKWS